MTIMIVNFEWDYNLNYCTIDSLTLHDEYLNPVTCKRLILPKNLTVWYKIKWDAFLH